MRYLLVEAAWRVLRTKDPAAAALRAWADGIAQRRGRSIAAVALARRLAGILYAMWRDGNDYRPPQPAAVAVTAAPMPPKCDPQARRARRTVYPPPTAL